MAGAVELLRGQLAREPDNGDAARLLAQTLYWLQDLSGAGAVYEAALTRHPQDTTLRLQYGRMLAETGERARARELVTPLQHIQTTEVEANALLGTIAYWEGDLTTAERCFETVLRIEPRHVEARRQYDEILGVTAPWIRVSSGFRGDDQPLDRIGVGIEAGWFANPLLPVTARVQPLNYRLADSTTRSLLAAEVAVAHFAPALRLETQLAGGVLKRSGSGDELDWTGRVALGVRLARSLVARVRTERTPYLYTESSLDVPVVARPTTALLHLENSLGWLGEAAYQHQGFPDDNAITTLYAWQLAPLLHRNAAEFQGGYSFVAENADESRFVLDRPVQPFPPDDPRFDFSGHYAPYYTPSHVITHSVIVAATLRPYRTTTVRMGGGYALHASEDAPAFAVSSGHVEMTMISRDFSPWNVRASVESALTGKMTLTASGELGRTAFYEWWTTGLQVTHRFRSSP
jgi:tetratricopeptide (TPR) repeat protein